jgi:hypothetical protein
LAKCDWAVAQRGPRTRPAETSGRSFADSKTAGCWVHSRTEFVTYPIETWADARDLHVRPGLTLFMVVAAVEPRFTEEPESYVPDAVTVARALRRVREEA